MIKSLTYLKRFKKQLILGPIFKLIEAIFELIVPLIMAMVIDNGINLDADGKVIGGNINYIIVMGIVIVSLGILGLASSLTCQFFASRASQGYGTVLRNELFKHINSLSFNELDQLGTNNLVNVMTNDINQLQLAVAMLIRLVIRAPFLVIGGLVMSFIINYKVGFIFLITIPIIAFFLAIIMKKSSKKYLDVQKKLDDLTLISSENLTGARVIKAFNKEEREINRFENKTIEYQKEAVNIAKITSFLNPITFLLINIAIIFIIYFGGIQVNIGNLTQGNVIALVNYMNQILLALIVVSNLVVIFTKAKASLDRCERVFSLQSSLIDGKDNVNENYPDIVRFENVSFKYPLSENYVIENIDFNLPKGKTLGIIGGTGSGKTTIINLIERFYDASLGNVYFCNKNIKNLNKEYLRNQIGLVSQKSILFKGNIRSNMLMAKKNATDEEIFEALKIANADFVLNLPDKLDHIVEEGGKNYSGGQRQRLTIARAILQKPQLLILDDSTSALDYLTDYNLRHNLATMMPKDMSLIIISQRANSLKNADEIIVIDEGLVVGKGNHNFLLKNCPTYQEIYKSQNDDKEVTK